MKKFAYVLAALGAMAVALPSIASAETIVIKRGGHHHGWYGARADAPRSWLASRLGPCRQQGRCDQEELSPLLTADTGKWLLAGEPFFCSLPTFA